MTPGAMLFAKWLPSEPRGMILTPAEAARQRAARRRNQRLAREAAARLLAARERPPRNSG